ncbi:uncharacterized protein L3040_004157 [Drepanopeziza brunnea f. sp. 'multigermtubi']|uniref:uncharacterized protein n=1 Tax=Drepanopeziza brunnea f. sp. 'multigermtubi' TaxID=698441 RepID=UPI00239D13CA|nr:hypothetical protein L3040_004157 [Drepanopeziza brunnea f. sp. 'multigermtubi']
MAMRLQRLFRAPRLPRRVTRRLVTTNAVSSSESADRIPLANVSETLPEVDPPAQTAESESAPPLRKEDPGLNQAKQTTKKQGVHRILSEAYHDGLLLRKGEDPLDRLDEKLGIPTWGPWGVPIKMMTSKGSLVSNMPNLWLRDNCRCEKCINGETMQRALDTFAIPQDIQPKEVRAGKDGLKITWANDGHVSSYSWDWIVKHKKGPGMVTLKNQEKEVDPTQFWDSSIGHAPPSVKYEEVMADDRGVGKWTAKIRKYGFCYVDGCPPTPEATKELLERIAFIRVTHYGGFYDFTADLTMKDTAYTNLALPAHTDTTYFTDPAGLQMFHLLSHTDGDGGASLLVDGFAAVKTLIKESPFSYEVLYKTPISWHASGNEGITITPAKKMPVLSLQDLEDGEFRKMLQIRWNNNDRGVVALKEDNGMGARKWYKAAAKFNDILNRKEKQYWAQMKPGSPLIFDNWRVLHGRSAFTGKRRVCGGYINHDDYISRWRNTNFTREKVLKQIL